MSTADTPLHDVDNVASELFEPRRWLRRLPGELFRDDDRSALAAEPPGIAPGSVDLDAEGQLLTIRAERTLAAGGGVAGITREHRDASGRREARAARVGAVEQ